MAEREDIRDAFFNGMISMRALNGLMTEACHKAFYAVGINSGSAQHEIKVYFQEEEFFFKRQADAGNSVILLPNFNDTKFFLDKMAIKYSGSSLFVNPAQTLAELKREKEFNEKEIVQKRSVRTRRQAGHGIDGGNEDHQTRGRRQNHSDRSKRNIRPESGSSKADQLHRERQSKLLSEVKVAARPPLGSS